MTRLIAALVCSIAIGCAGAAQADQNDPRLNDLFERLQHTDNRLEADSIEAAIWGIWFSSTNAEVNRLIREKLALG